jgi:hypothetical protein
MKTFWHWLAAVIAEARRPEIPPEVLHGYELAFQDQLRGLIQRTQDPRLRAVLTDMLDCPIRDARGNCRSFTDFIVGAMIRNGIHHRYDMEAALAYIAEKLLMDRTASGGPRASLFVGFQERPGYEGGNPVLARFLKFLEWAINNIRKGKIVRLANVEQRPTGTVSIGLGRKKDADPAGGVSPDDIAARPSPDPGLGELVGDIETLLRRKEKTYPLPLVDLFRRIMAGERTDQQVRRFGDRPTRTGRQVIVDTIRDYAEKSQNFRLLHLLRQFEGFQSNKPMPLTRKPVKTPRPVLSDKDRDYASIVSVVARFTRPVGTADLGRFRRRWLDYPPRNPSSGFRNRLEEVLANMAEDGVLKAIQTRAGATVYEPGPVFAQYRQEVGVV